MTNLIRERDPRTDPHPGDVVYNVTTLGLGAYLNFYVVEVNEKTVFFSIDHNRKYLNIMPIDEWRTTTAHHRFKRAVE